MDHPQCIDWKIPLRHWTDLSEYDRQRYHELRLFFKQQQKDSLRGRKSSPFSHEITTILTFIDQSTPGRDSRCIMCGLGCGGPFICANTQQLKHLLGRCKSSINTSFQQIGYGVLRNREKSRDALWAIVPDLRADSAAIRQWTVRCANESCSACFFSTFTARGLPQMMWEDFADEKRNVRTLQPIPWLGKKVTFETPKVEEKEEARFDEGELGFAESFSVDFLAGFDAEMEMEMERESNSFESLCESKEGMGNQGGGIKRSKSLDLEFGFQ
jgi:hypothetical protein